MRDNIKTFAHESGVIILSKNQLVTDQLKVNPNFFEFFGSFAGIHIFVSQDLKQDIKTNGLPLQIKKFLAGRVDCE